MVAKMTVTTFLLIKFALWFKQRGTKKGLFIYTAQLVATGFVQCHGSFAHLLQLDVPPKTIL